MELLPHQPITEPAARWLWHAALGEHDLAERSLRAAIDQPDWHHATNAFRIASWIAGPGVHQAAARLLGCPDQKLDPFTRAWLRELADRPDPRDRGLGLAGHLTGVARPAAYARYLATRLGAVSRRTHRLRPNRRQITETRRRAILDQYDTLLETLDQVFRDRDVLVLGSGPSARQVDHVANDTLVVAVNRAPIRLTQIDIGRIDLLWFISGALGKHFWSHVEEIARALPAMRSVTVVFEGWLDPVISPKNKIDWGDAARRLPLAAETGVLPADDHRYAPPPLNQLPPAIRFSSGLTSVKLAASMRPRRVHLAGIDLGHPLEDQPGGAYFYGEADFSQRVAQTLPRSTQIARHPFDAMLLETLGQRARLHPDTPRLATLSARSRSARCLPVVEPPPRAARVPA